MVEVAPARWDWAARRTRPRRGRGAPRFFDGEIDRLHRQHRRPAQAVGRRRAVLRAPVVVGAATGGQQLRIVELPTEQLAARRRIEHLGVDALLVHVGEARGGAEAGLAQALEALHAAPERGDELGRVEAVAALLVGERLALHHHACGRRRTRRPAARDRGTAGSMRSAQSRGGSIWWQSVSITSLPLRMGVLLSEVPCYRVAEFGGSGRAALVGREVPAVGVDAGRWRTRCGGRRRRSPR